MIVVKQKFSLEHFLSNSFLGNSVKHWILSICSLLVFMVLIYIFKKYFINKIKKSAQKTKSSWDDFIVEILERFLVPVLYLTCIYFVFSNLISDKKIHSIIHIVYAILFAFFTMRITTKVAKKFLFSFILKQENPESKKEQATGLIIVINILVWGIGIIFLMDNLGYDVTTLIAGLGIGGIALALAAQAVLGDLFSYFVIFFDRPFEIGDFIIVDDKSGTIEHVGVKTTRIRTLGGEQLICSNTDLTNARMHNFKRLEKRRKIFTLGVTYQTSVEKLTQIPVIVNEIISSQSDIELERGHLTHFGDFSINFEFVYYVLSSDFIISMDKQQIIFFEILSTFQKLDIEFAYPTQSLFIHSENQEIQSK